MEDFLETDIKQLNSFLRGELSATETYQQCIDTIDDPVIRSQLKLLMESHRNRAMVLDGRITALGGRPNQSSGVWGSLVRALEGSATFLGVTAALSLLEEGEDHGRETYEKNFPRLSGEQQAFIRDVIYPEQLKTLDILRRIETDL